MVIVEIKSFSFDYTNPAATIALNFFRARAASREPTPRSRMKAKRQPVKLQAKRTAPPGAQTYLLGVDGGGTKTRAVVVDARQRILGEGEAGPSNPLPVGVSDSANAVRDPAERGRGAAGARRIEVGPPRGRPAGRQRRGP